LADRERGQLRSKIADSDGSKPLEIQIPIGSGIAGHVATTGQTLSIPDPYNHPYFDPDVDRETGYRTKSILCMPIFDRQKNVLAVAELLNKNGGEPFTAEDEKAFREFASPLGLVLESCLRMTQPRSRATAPQ
jgi:adenylate cyclase